MDAQHTTTNYPDLYVNAHTATILVENPTIVNIREDGQLPLETMETGVEMTPFPGRSLYKDYKVSNDECAFVEEIQEFSQGVIRVATIQDPKTTEGVTKPKKNEVEETRWVSTHPLWTIVQLVTEIIRLHNEVTEIIRFNNEMQSTVTVKVQVGEKGSNKTTKNSELVELKEKLSDLEEELEKEQKELSQGKYKSKSEKQEKINKLKLRIAVIEKRIDELENSNDGNNKLLRIVLGTIGLITVPLIGKFMGEDLGVLLYTLRLKSKQKACTKLLKDVEEHQDGTHNPHFRLVQAGVSSFNKGVTKMVAHTSISLACKTTIGIGAIISVIGAYNNSRSMLKGSLTLAVGLGAFVLEQLRYLTADKEDVKQALSTAAKYSSQVLSVKDPFIPAQLYPPVNPEIAFPY